ncbi:zinc finger (AN1-like) family protein [Wolffia australiana]
MACGTEAFPDLGRHCEEESCGQLDFLPFLCDCCHKAFCKEHRSYADHGCEKAGHASRTVVVCEACSASVERRGGEDDNAALARHVASSGACDPSKKRRTRCPARACREKLSFSNAAACRLCRQRLCLRHRFPDSHSCRCLRKTDPPSASAVRVC